MVDKVVYDESGTVHRRVQVIDRGHIRFMRFGTRGGWQGALDSHKPNRFIFPYQRAFASFVRSLPGVTSFLALGVGTGTALKTVSQVHPNSALYGLELDKTVIDVAIQYFDAPGEPEATYRVGDGISYLSYEDVQVELLLVDAYLENRVYGPCLDVNFPAILDAATTERGIIVCNIITSLPVRGRVRDYLDSATRYFHVFLLPVGLPIPFVEQNVLCVFTKDSNVLEMWRSHLRHDTQVSLRDRIHWMSLLKNYQRSMI